MEPSQYPSLPKWPQLIITGPNVDPEHAKEFILKTDGFLTDFSEYAGGNEREFNASYRRKAGADILDGIQSRHSRWEVQKKVRKRIGFVDLQYVSSDFASSSFIGGPHGVVSPAGVVSYAYNVGKWPTVEDILTDFKALARAFPWLELWATVYDREWGEEGGVPLATFRVKSGRARIAKVKDLQDQVTPANISLAMFSRSELGLPCDWYDEIAAVVRTVTEAVVKEVRENDVSQ
ncbi:MAG: hypothetical protein LAT68_16515 [Cyclobacteriaceae bacterium]|nr:hypothetical protein [Cyclobacteriaceae bacterium]